jgi:hypothetical protein
MMIKSKRMRWAEHATRMGEGWMMNTEFWSEYLKRITRSRWEKNIIMIFKMDLDRIGGRAWLKAALL